MFVYTRRDKKLKNLKPLILWTSSVRVDEIAHIYSEMPRRHRIQPMLNIYTILTHEIAQKCFEKVGKIAFLEFFFRI